MAKQEIKTIEDLVKANPELAEMIEQFKKDIIASIESMTVEKFKQICPKLYAKIVSEVQGLSKPNLNVNGFLLNIGDPFAEGALRTYAHLKKQPNLRLPYVLPFSDKVTKPALNSYILRADGGGDKERANKAKKVLAEKFGGEK